MKKIVGILVCMLMIVPVLTCTVTADPDPVVDIKISGGLGVTVEVTNIGEESFESSMWVEMIPKFLPDNGPPGLGARSVDLEPGETDAFRLLPIYPRFPFSIYFCTISVRPYASGDDFEEVSVDALRISIFVILLE